MELWAFPCLGKQYEHEYSSEHVSSSPLLLHDAGHSSTWLFNLHSTAKYHTLTTLQTSLKMGRQLAVAIQVGKHTRQHKQA